MEETNDATRLGPDWTRIQRWLQDAAMELEYLVLRVGAKRNGGRMPENAPAIFALANDMAAPLTEAGLKMRIKEICKLADGWATSESFPQF